MPSNPNREYRSMPLNIEKRAEGEEKSYIVEGYATTFGDTYELYRDGRYIVKERVDKNAFANTDMSDVVFQFDHEGRVYARTKNGTVELNVDNIGLHQKTDLGRTSSSRAAFEDIEAGNYYQMSFAFTVTDDEYEEEEQDNGDIILTRTIKEIGKLYDVSAVSFPANPYTSISARTKELCDGEIAKIEAERLHREEIRNKREAILARLRQEEKTND
ncbi:MAG: HK97 family phage prohead protease [Lachnospiraceae bacterium]|nr:HK97 family phage prohead protease [Lachnospiraceae bacterium]